MQKAIVPLLSSALQKNRNHRNDAHMSSQPFETTTTATETTDSDDVTEESRIPSVDEFILRSQDQAFHCLENAYL
jgi:hypothetical protein